MHDFSVIICRCCKNVYVNSCFPCMATLWNSLTIECFTLTYGLYGFNSSINCRFFLKRFPVCFNLFVLLFQVAPCLVVAIQPCKELIFFFKKNIIRLIQAYLAPYVTLIYSQPCHIPSPGIFRTWSIFKTLQKFHQAYSVLSIVRIAYSGIIKSYSAIFRSLCNAWICRNLAYLESRNI